MRDSVSMVNLRTYIDIIHPRRFRETIEREAKKEDGRATFINIFLISLLEVFMNIITYPVLQRPAPAGVDEGSFLYKMTTFSPVASPSAIMVTLISGVILYYLMLAVQHAIAKALGGNGKLGNLLYCDSTAFLSFTAIVLPFRLAIVVPVLGCVALLPSLVIGIYGAYIYYKILRAVYTSLSRGRAIAAYILFAIAAALFSLIYIFLRIALGI